MKELNTAQTLLEKMGVATKNEIEVEINGVTLKFYKDNAAYDAFLNDFTEKNKVTPAKDYLLAIIAPQSREDLLEMINVPNLAIQVAGVINEEFLPKLQISVKK